MKNAFDISYGCWFLCPEKMWIERNILMLNTAAGTFRNRVWRDIIFMGTSYGGAFL